VPFGQLWPLGLACIACGSVKVQPPADGSVGGNVDGNVDGSGRMVMCAAGQQVDVLENGNFDAIDPPWRQDPPAPSLLCGQPRIMPDTGPFAGCLGGGADRSINTLSRDVFLPLGAISARLTGRICIATEEVDPLDNDILTIDILDGTTVIGSLGRRTNQQGAVSCQFTSFTLEAPLTRDPVTATFRLQSQLDVGRATSFYVDTLTLTVACR
jgi:hypothetical protein